MWSVVSKWMDACSCQIAYCTISLISTVIFIFADGYKSFVVGLIVYSLSIAGYSGLKSVVWIEVVSLPNLATVTTLEAIFSGMMAVVGPMLFGFLAVLLRCRKILFYFQAMLITIW